MATNCFFHILMGKCLQKEGILLPLPTRKNPFFFSIFRLKNVFFKSFNIPLGREERKDRIYLPVDQQLHTNQQQKASHWGSIFKSEWSCFHSDTYPHKCTSLSLISRLYPNPQLNSNGSGTASNRCGSEILRSRKKRIKHVLNDKKNSLKLKVKKQGKILQEKIELETMRDPWTRLSLFSFWCPPPCSTGTRWRIGTRLPSY